MRRCRTKYPKAEKLSNQFYGVNLLFGNINLKPKGIWTLYYIVENTTDKEFIEKEAFQTVLLINTDSREFHFYGKQAQLWENAFDLADVAIRPTASDEEVALTIVYRNLDDFIDTLQEEIAEKEFISQNIYLIYDDETLYKYILSKLKY